MRTPKVGDMVRLKASAWTNLAPRTPEEGASWIKWHRVTYVGENLGYSYDPIWPIYVDCTMMNRYLLDISMFDQVP